MRAASRSVVDSARTRHAIAPEASPAWEEVAHAMATAGRGLPATPSSRTRRRIGRRPELAAFARASFLPGRPLLEAAVDLMHRIHASSPSTRGDDDHDAGDARAGRRTACARTSRT